MAVSQETKEDVANMIAERILKGLQTQDFYDWYNSDFEEFIQDSESGHTEEQILKRIKSLFKIN